MPISISRCELLHHGAAANSSHKVIACIPSADSDILQGDDENKDTNITLGSTELVYASHLMLNVAKPKKISISNATVDESTGVGTQEKIWNVEQTLRTSTSLTEAEAETAAANVSTRTAKRVITCVVQLGWVSQMESNDNKDQDVVLVCGFSDGTLTSWYRPRHRNDWEEHVLLKSTQDRKNSMSSSEISLEEDAVAAMKGRSITDIDGYVTVNNNDNDDDKQKRRLDLSVVACSSGGAQYFQFTLILNNHRDSEQNNNYTQIPLQESNHATIKDMKRLIRTPSNSIKFHAIATGSSGNDIENVLGIFLVGTAAPRHNKIHVFETPSSYMQRSTRIAESQTTISKSEFAGAPKYSGSLTGHEDWITCFHWSTAFFSALTDVAQNKGTGISPTDSCCYLASGSQDAKIRLWKWVTTETKVTAKNTSSEKVTDVIGEFEAEEISDIISKSGEDDEEDDDDEEVIEGEARLEIHHAGNTSNYEMTTSVYLEALLIGHEEMVTSVAWHPNPKKVFDRDLVLFSSSMDRSIFLWCTSSNDDEANDGSDGVWTPMARVGSPTGILGGPVGSSLLGYLHVQIEPEHGRWIMGHAYGGALHFFSAEQYIDDERITDVASEHTDMTIKKQADVKWKAQPCITGHFDEVNDLCWEALEGEYLITVSNDATCRIWAPIAPSLETWIEISRPQVHGYSLSAVTSLSTCDHKHHLVTGADEKELRVFDGTKSFLRVLRLVGGGQGDRNAIEANDDITRVDRAYMPSLGLSNKDTASEGADEDTGEGSTSSTSLPIERDLGSTSLWPETRKMYGHNSEIARLASTLSSRTCLSLQFVSPHMNQILVASSTKARDVNTATIRLWDVDENRCLQTLQGGHRSTVTAMSFSPDGTYLASSGKDRRLCIWKRHPLENSSEQNDLFFLASAVNSSHKRIVWSVHFCPYNPTILASGSRDGTVKLWKISEGSVEGNQDTSVKELLKFVPTLHGDSSGMSKGKPEAVTSLAFSPSRLFGTSRGILAIGLENGLVQLWSVPITQCSDDNSVEPPSLALAFDPQLCHIGAIKKLAWRPMRDDNEGPLVLASCASDNGCRIFSVWLGNE